MNCSPVITIGNFDGVHAGHRAILARARAIADDEGVTVTAMTFDPHPASVLRPGDEPPRLTGRQERIKLLRQVGADDVVVLEPSPAMLAQTPEQFVGRLHVERRPMAIVEGPNFRFGKDRRGDVTLLKALGDKLGFAVVVVDAVDVALSDQLAAPVSSTLVRWLLGQGRVGDAARCLGRLYSITAPVVEGERRGRTIGVPTVNLDPAALGDCQLPADAVYAGVVDVPGGGAHAAAVSIGAKPTFDGRRRVVEAHLLDFAGDLYGQRLTVHFARWLRDQQRFPDADALRRQLQRDVAETRRLHAMGLLQGAAAAAARAG